MAAIFQDKSILVVNIQFLVSLFVITVVFFSLIHIIDNN